MMRIANVDTLSALLDRLVVENIKRFFFEKDGLIEKVQYQDRLIAEIRNRLSQLLLECISNGQYEYLKEQRTFPAVAFIQELEQLICNNLQAGEAVRAKLAELETGKPSLETIVQNELQSRKANERRAKSKNNLDELFQELLERGESKEE